MGICIKSQFLPLLTSVKKHSERIVVATFQGNPRTTIVSCYAPHNSLPDDDAIDFYSNLNSVVSEIPQHDMLLICGDFNAHLISKFSLHKDSNRNGNFLSDFIHENNLIVGNLSFRKKKNKLWTYRSPKGVLSQIDFCMYRKRWRNSVKNCQAYSTSNPVGSDHRMVSMHIKLSLRITKINSSKRLYWAELAKNTELAKKIVDKISEEFGKLSPDLQSYKSFVKTADSVGSKHLPSNPKPEMSTADHADVTSTRSASISARPGEIQAAQNLLRRTFDLAEDNRINDILKRFESPATPAAIKTAWTLVKKLSGKISSKTICIEGENRLETWKNHFEKLLNNEKVTPIHQQEEPDTNVVKIFDNFPEIPTGELSQAEVDASVKSMKNGKAPGLDGLPPEFWKLSKVKKQLLKFCNMTYFGNRPEEWGFSGLVPVPKKGDLRLPDNYRGISLSQIAAKVYNRCLLNRIRPVIDIVLRPNQNGFRQNRSTTSHILALRRICEELKNHNQEAVIVFIDFKKAFDSIDRDKMLEILTAYGIPNEIVSAIEVMYRNTSAQVISPDGMSDCFAINTGVLQGDPLAPFLFIICLDYVLRTVLKDDDGFTLKRQRSRRCPAQTLSDLDYADDIALLDNSIKDAQDLLIRVETACQAIGLYLNSPKTKYMHLNNPCQDSNLFSSDGSIIELVDDFKYLGGYTDTDRDMEARIGQAWGALNSLRRLWKSPLKKSTKTKVFKACIESILLYGSESWTLNVKRSARLNGTYTKMLRSIYSVSWRDHISNKVLYGNLPSVSTIVRRRRLALAGHVVRGKEPAGELLFWEPEGPRRVGRPRSTLKQIIEGDIGLKDQELRSVMVDRKIWKGFINASPESEDFG